MKLITLGTYLEADGVRPTHQLFTIPVAGAATKKMQDRYLLNPAHLR